MADAANPFAAKLNKLDIARSVLFVPPLMPVGDLLPQMQQKRVHMAVVIDEYGGTDGLVTIEDLLEAVSRGIDVCDCVLPTRNGRHGLAFTRRGTVNLRNARHADDPRPLDEESANEATRTYSRAYLHYLIKAGELTAKRLLTLHNLTFMALLMDGLRAAIRAGRLEEYSRQVLAGDGPYGQAPAAGATAGAP